MRAHELGRKAGRVVSGMSNRLQGSHRVQYAMPAETGGNRSHHLVYKRESFTHRAHKSDSWLFPMRLGVHKRPFTSARPQVPVHKCRSPFTSAVHKCRVTATAVQNLISRSCSEAGFPFYISVRGTMSRDGRFPSHRARPPAHGTARLLRACCPTLLHAPAA